MNNKESQRAEAVDLVLSGLSIRKVARKMKHSASWVLKWLRRFGNGLDWSKDLSRRPHRSPNRLPESMEAAIVRLRQQLQAQSRVQYGPQAIQYLLARQGVQPLPSRQVISKVIHRQGLVQRRNGRFQPKGIPYPQVAPAQALLQEADTVGPRYIQDHGRFFSLHVMLVASRQIALEPRRHFTDPVIQQAFWAIWRRLGLPQYLQMDNKPPFAPSAKNPFLLPGFLRLCLELGIQPVFIPLAEPWHNPHIERFNDTYDKRFFRMERFRSYQAAVLRTSGFEREHNRSWRYSSLQHRTPDEVGASLERPFPSGPKLPRLTKAVPPGHIHVVRFIRSDKKLNLFGFCCQLSTKAQYRYVHVRISIKAKTLEVLLDGQPIKAIRWKVQ